MPIYFPANIRRIKLKLGLTYSDNFRKIEKDIRTLYDYIVSLEEENKKLKNEIIDLNFRIKEERKGKNNANNN